MALLKDPLLLVLMELRSYSSAEYVMVGFLSLTGHPSVASCPPTLPRPPSASCLRICAPPSGTCSGMAQSMRPLIVLLVGTVLISLNTHCVCLVYVGAGSSELGVCKGDEVATVTMFSHFHGQRPHHGEGDGDQVLLVYPEERPRMLGKAGPG